MESRRIPAFVTLVLLCFLGLLALLTPAYAGDCGGTRIETAPSGWITDGTGPYVGGTECRWQIEAEPGNLITLIFNQFDTECKWDYLRVIDGDPTLGTGMTIAALSGSRKPAPIVTTSNTVKIVFVSEENSVFQGFNITYIASPCPYNCSGVGTCISGVCSCIDGYHGSGCQFHHCPSNCSGRGVCDQVSHVCICNPGFTGRSCYVRADMPYWKSYPVDCPVPLVGTKVVPLEGTNQLVAFSSFLYDLPYGGMIWYNYDTPDGWSLSLDSGFPEARSDHITVLADGVIYIHGGRLGIGVADDLWKYDLAHGNWTKITAPGGPPATFGHCGVYVDSLRTIVIFGGQTIIRTLSSEVYHFNIDTQTWYHVPTTGTRPPGLTFPVMVYDERRNRILIHGGASSTGLSTSYSAQLYSYSPFSLSFTLLNPTGNLPPALYSHGGNILGDYLIITSGSLPDCTSSQSYALHLLCNRWTLLNPSFAGKDGSTMTNTRRTSFAPFVMYGFFHLGGGFSGILRHDVLQLVADTCSWITTEAGCDLNPGCAWQTSGNSSWCLETQPSLSQGVVFASLGTNRVSCSECDLYFNSVECGLSENCVWCASDSQCLEASTFNFTQSNCSTNDPCEKEHADCGTCLQDPRCAWCEADHLCILAESSRPGCPSGGSNSCGDACEAHESCASCAHDDACGWCEFSNLCISVSRQCPQQSERLFRDQCPEECEEITSCTDCAIHPHCVWCNNLQTCTGSSVYTTSYPYGKCASFAYGPIDCPAPCTSYLDCESCVEHTHCGWCLGNATMTPRCLSGDYFQPTDPMLCSPSNWTQVATSCEAHPTQEPQCYCNGHSDECNANGVCVGCRHSTRNGPAGSCDICASSSFFGSPLNGGTCWYHLRPEVTTNLSCDRGDRLVLRTLTSLAGFESIAIHFNVIVGSATLYYSRTDDHPSAASNDGSLSSVDHAAAIVIELKSTELFLAVFPASDATFVITLTSSTEGVASDNLGLLFYLLIGFASLFVLLFFIAFGYKIRQHIVTRGQKLAYELAEAKPYLSVTAIVSPSRPPSFLSENHPLQTPIFLDPLGDTGRVFLATVLVDLPSHADRHKFAFGHAVLIQSKQQQQGGK